MSVGAAPAPAPSEPAPAPAPVPVSLPNTGAGILEPLNLLASLGASALTGGLALRRRARDEEPAEQPAPAEAE
jgi:LPXTG-motif cell wall-anchored protein